MVGILEMKPINGQRNTPYNIQQDSRKKPITKSRFNTNESAFFSAILCSTTLLRTLTVKRFRYWRYMSVFLTRGINTAFYMPYGHFRVCFSVD